MSEGPRTETGVQHTYTHQTMNHESRKELKQLTEEFPLAMENGSTWHKARQRIMPRMHQG